MDFDQQSKAYKLQQNSQRTVPATIQQQQPAIPLAGTQALQLQPQQQPQQQQLQLQSQPQRPLQGKQQGDQQDEHCG
ncbi:hypothetical protein EJ02DRAFT_494131, partial [Clathrospora elynae]